MGILLVGLAKRGGTIKSRLGQGKTAVRLSRVKQKLEI